MSQQIDFLPTRYREQKVRRRSRLWLLSVLGIFACVIAITYSVQIALYKSAENQLATVQFQHRSARATQNVYDRLQKNLARVQASASLYTYLQSTWPRTQIILAVARPLTGEISLSELTVTVEAEQPEERRRGLSRSRRPAPESKPADGLPAQNDLDALRDELTDKRTVVRVSGTTTDDVALHRYVSRLSNDLLFEKAELMNLESSSGGGTDSAEFLVRIIVCDSDPALANASATARQDAKRHREGGRR